MKRILLITPDMALDTGFAEMIQGRDSAGRLKAAVAPLQLATLAALTPPGFEVDLWDEAVEGKITASSRLAKTYDLAGITGYQASIPRMLELCQEFRRRGAVTVAGGPGVSGSPHRFRGSFDVIFLGEAEFTWPQFLLEWTAGTHSAEYRQIERPDLASSPVPRWDKVQGLSTAYAVVGVQTTRGCPYDCEFCDVIHLFGRRPRHKPIQAVLEEVTLLQSLGVKQISFSDDNFVGELRYAKDLLRQLIPLNQSFDRPVGFSTQITINHAKDEEMLRLMAEANFKQLYIGVETPRKASLEEVHKFQNTQRDMLEDIRRIQSYGIFVKAMMMVGFDNDDPTIFDELYEFMKAASVTHFRFSMLHAYPGTPQTARLLKQGRVLDLDLWSEGKGTFAISNVIPAQMTREQMFNGYCDVQERLLAWNHFGERLLAFLNGISYVPAHAKGGVLTDPERLARMRSALPRLVRAPALVRIVLFKLLALKSDQNAEGLRFLSKLATTLDGEGRAVLAEAIEATLERAPWLLNAVLYRIFLHVDNLSGLARIRRELAQRLEIEKAPGYQHKLLGAVQIPPNFKRLYKEAFTITLNGLRAGLDNNQFVAEGLVRVWKDFIIRYGAEFEKFEDYHFVSLQELVERTIEQGNAGEFSHTRSMAQANDLTSAQLRSLSEQILFTVEQDLKSESSSQLVRLTLGQPVPATM